MVEKCSSHRPYPSSVVSFKQNRFPALGAISVTELGEWLQSCGQGAASFKARTECIGNNVVSRYACNISSYKAYWVKHYSCRL